MKNVHPTISAIIQSHLNIKPLMPVKQTQHFEKTIQALPVEAYGTPGDMYFKIYDRHGRLHFTSSNPCADQQQCWQRAAKIIIQYWESQNEND